MTLGALVCYLFAAFLPAAKCQQDLRSAFKARLSPAAEVYVPSDPGYTQAVTQRFTIYEQPTFQIAVKPDTDDDIVQTIRIATEKKLPFLGTGGGHGLSTTLGKLDNGVQIDLSRFKKVDIKGDTVTIGAGVLNGEIWDPIYLAGKELQTGSASCIGVMGAAVAGGLGRLTGLHGAAIDSLQSLRVVTSKGTIVTASATENPDLFFGMRGAGMNYGIVTEATFQLHPQTNNGNAMIADFIFPGSQSRKHWETIKTFESTLPAELSLTTTTMWMDAFGGPVLILSAVYIGPETTGRDLIAPFVANGPAAQNILTVPYNKVAATASFGTDPVICQKGANRNAYGLGIRNVDIDTLTAYSEAFAALLTSHPDLRPASIFNFEVIPNAAAVQVPEDATAYPHRDVFAHLLLQFAYPPGNASLEKTVTDFAQSERKALAASSGYDTLKVYVNYGHGDEGPEAWYGAKNLPRLRKAKRKWDPSNMFGWMNPVGR